MNKWLTWVLVAVVLVSFLGLTAIGKDHPHNLVITAGGGNSLLQVVQRLNLYGVDSKTGKRTEDPIVKVSEISDPLYLLILKGTYDIIVYVPWAPGGVLLGQVAVAKNEVVVFDTRDIDLPSELQVR